ncbi:MAG TPA: transcription termination factor Rho, partial [Ectothiorhodospiraceae bacterium]|nr:transcription termination factor Rho [Ectothiorhodospiraceae bacterium]
MNVSELKQKSTTQLYDIATEMGLDNINRAKREQVVFNILKAAAKKGEELYGGGVLEILQDGFGFLRSAGSSYLAGPDDVYISPSQIRRFHLRTGDTILGKIRAPKDNERYFALIKIDEINFEAPENTKRKVRFENLTAVHPVDQINLESGNGSTEDITARIIDLVSPIGKG